MGLHLCCSLCLLISFLVPDQVIDIIRVIRVLRSQPIVEVMILSQCKLIFLYILVLCCTMAPDTLI